MLLILQTFATHELPNVLSCDFLCLRKAALIGSIPSTSANLARMIIRTLIPFIASSKSSLDGLRVTCRGSHKNLSVNSVASIQDEVTWAMLISDNSQPIEKSHIGRIAIKVIIRLGDEVFKVFKVE